MADPPEKIIDPPPPSGTGHLGLISSQRGLMLSMFQISFREVVVGCMMDCRRQSMKTRFEKRTVVFFKPQHVMGSLWVRPVLGLWMARGAGLVGQNPQTSTSKGPRIFEHLLHFSLFLGCTTRTNTAVNPQNRGRRKKYTLFENTCVCEGSNPLNHRWGTNGKFTVQSP